MASFVYTEKSPSGAVSEGHVSVPAEFLIGIPVFEDGPAYTIRAKLRYRIDRSSGELRLWYELQQLQRVFAKAMEAHVQKLEELFVRRTANLFRPLINTALSIEGAKQKRIEKSVRFCFYGGQNDCSNEKGPIPRELMGK